MQERRKARAQEMSVEIDGEASPADRSLEEAPSEPSRCDQLEYLADMVRELVDLANRQSSPTLAGLLELAEREARLEAIRSLRDRR